MRFLINLLLFFLAIFGCNGQVSYQTVPERQPGEDKIIIKTSVGETNLSIYCRVASSPIPTTWEINGLLLDFSTIDGTSVTSGYTYLSIGSDLENQVNKHNLSFTTPFMAEYDRLEIICRTGNGSSTEQETFLFGIPAPPKLDNVSEVYNVIEYEPFSLDLSSVSDPFPPGSESSIWTFNGTELAPAIQQLLGITLDTYNVSMDYTFRAQTGVEVQVNVSNKHGYDVKSFSLNVQYPPEAEVIHGDSTVYGIFNESVELIAVESLDGNPYPNITWRDPNDTMITFLHDRFSTPTDGVLVVNPIGAQDYGKFLFVAQNGIGTELLVEFTLIQATEPGEPTNLDVIYHDDRLAFISWFAPIDLGTPPLNNYKIELISNMGTEYIVTNYTDFELMNLSPGTAYNITVRAISDSYPNGGDASAIATFTTDHSTAQFRNVSVLNDDGNIVVHYDLLHNGGYGKEDITVDATCSREETNLGVGSGSPDNNDDDGSGSFIGVVYGICDQDCDFTGSLTIDGSHILRAGDTYYCSINVQNPEGTQSIYNNPVTVITGRPTNPIIKWEYNDDSNIVTLYLRSVHAGIDPADERSILTFHVLIRSANGSVVHNTTTTATESNSTVTLSLRIRENGNYVILVTAINEYGFSDIVMENITISRTPTRSSSSPSPSASPTFQDKDPRTNVGAIVAGVVVPVVVLAVAAAIGVVAVLVVIFMKQKTKKGRKVGATDAKVKPPMADEAAVTPL